MQVHADTRATVATARRTCRVRCRGDGRATGDVLALVGGRDFDDSQFNRATQAMRQPGSAFKPFVYAAALSSGYSPAHRLLDQPLRYVLDNGRVWEPRNYDGSYSGVVSMRHALTHSKNVPTVRLANERRACARRSAWPSRSAWAGCRRTRPWCSARRRSRR
jgi:hypothetical protein